MSAAVRLLFAALVVAATPSLAAGTRYALIFANDRGDPGDVLLRYAEADANRLAEVLEDVGGVTPNHLTVVHAATASSVRAAMSKIRKELTDSDDEWLIYVSGHADEGELHLGGTRLPFDELADFAKTLPVRLVVTVVDSCRSGVATRLKGLQIVGGPTVIAESPVEGRVVIASSSPEESAQESDVLKGSVFTHHFVNGLRGAADQSGDGRISVSEAYAYAKDQTVASTFATSAGPQHPEFHVDLRGSADLVLTDVSQAQATLELLDPTPGVVAVLNQSGSAPLFEVPKKAAPMRLALPAGPYHLWLRSADGGIREASFVLPSAGQLTLRSRDLTVVVGGELARSKGDDALPLNPLVRISVAPLMHSGVVSLLGPMWGGSVRGHLKLRRQERWFISAAAWAAAGRATEYSETEIAGRAGIGWGTTFGIASLFGAFEVGGLVIHQTAPTSVPRTSLVPTLSPTLGLDVAVARHVAITAEASASAAWLITINGSRPSLSGSLAVGVAVSW